MIKVEDSITDLPTLRASVPKIPSVAGFTGAQTINVGGKPYEGEYEVTPKFTLQKLDTKGAILQEDIIVNQISVNKVANNAGGNTIVIGD